MVEKCTSFFFIDGKRAFNLNELKSRIIIISFFIFGQSNYSPEVEEKLKQSSFESKQLFQSVISLSVVICYFFSLQFIFWFGFYGMRFVMLCSALLSLWIVDTNIKYISSIHICNISYIYHSTSTQHPIYIDRHTCSGCSWWCFTSLFFLPFAVLSFGCYFLSYENV